MRIYYSLFENIVYFLFAIQIKLVNSKHNIYIFPMTNKTLVVESPDRPEL